MMLILAINDFLGYWHRPAAFSSALHWSLAPLVSELPFNFVHMASDLTATKLS